MTTTTDWKELARRETDGLVVSLLWSKTADRVKVAVADTQLDDELQVEVPGPCALDAFYHPFAYASGRGACFDAALQPQTLVAQRSADS